MSEVVPVTQRWLISVSINISKKSFLAFIYSCWAFSTIDNPAKLLFRVKGGGIDAFREPRWQPCIYPFFLFLFSHLGSDDLIAIVFQNKQQTLKESKQAKVLRKYPNLFLGVVWPYRKLKICFNEVVFNEMNILRSAS